jgi:hypothetical protein
MKASVWRRTRRNCHHFSTMRAHETIENSSRIARTNYATGPACRISTKTPELSVSEVDK